MISVPYEVKKALRDGMLRKNYRFVVLNDDGTEDFTIDNDTLVSESVIIDERMCSGDKLKFGLCEGSSLEFQYFNHPNISGRRVQVFIDVFYTDQDYEAIAELEPNGAHYITQEACSYLFTVPANTTGAVIRKRENTTVTWRWYLSDRPQQTDFYGRVGDDFYVTSDTSGFSITMSKEVFPYSLPMGFFDVKKCSRQASTGIMKVTAYNKLQSDYLNQKANLVLSESFAQSTSTIVAYVTSILLGDYRIVEGYSMSGTIVPPGGGGGDLPVIDTTRSLSGTLPLYLPAYGVNSPLNSYQYSTGPLYLGMVSAQRYFYYEVNYVRKKLFMFFKKGGFVALERAIYSFLKKVLDEAQFTDGNGNSISGQAILDDICTNSNFAYICGIRSLNVGTQLKWYSTIQWEFEEAHGLTHKVAGNANDGLVQQEYGAMMILPYSYGLNQSGTSIDSSREVSFDGHDYGRFGYQMAYGTYKYYLDSSQTVSGTKNAPIFAFNGEIYPTSYDVIKDYWGAKLREDLGIDGTSINIRDLPDFTLRDMQAAVYETECQFGQLSRVTDLFTGVELNYGGLYPADTLYPANDLYPGGAPISASKSMYNKLWADEGNVHKWRNLVITYKGLDGDNNEVDIVHERVIDANGTDDYNMSDNWLFRNLIWTEEQIDDYADAMIAKMQHHEWFPFEMWLAGLPYLETGDEIEIPLNDVVYTSYVLQRQLKGIQSLQDTYINGTLDIF